MPTTTRRRKSWLEDNWSLPIDPGQQFVYPLQGKPEPSVGTLLLAAEAQDEVAEGVLLEGQSHVHKTHVPEAPFVGILHRIPDGDDVRVQMVVRLAPEGRVPQISIPLAVGHCWTADHLAVIFGHKEPARFLFRHEQSEEGIVGDIALRLEDMVLSQQLRERLEVLLRLDHLCRHPALVGTVYAPLHLVGDALLGGVAVQRVVHAHPVDRVEAQLSQLLVAQHLLTQVAHLYI